MSTSVLVRSIAEVELVVDLVVADILGSGYLTWLKVVVVVVVDAVEGCVGECLEALHTRLVFA